MPEPGDVPDGDLLRDIDLVPVGGRRHRWALELSPAWNVVYAFGGTTMAAAIRAAERTLDRPDLDLLTATATFCAPVPDGPVALAGRVLRDGRTAAQAVAELHTGDPDGGEPALHLTAVFGQRQPIHVDYVDLEFPADAPAVADCPTRDEVDSPSAEGDAPFQDISFHRQVEWRPAIGASPAARDWVPGPARYGAWFRFLAEPRRADGSLDPVALAVPADSLGGAVWQRLGPFGPDNPPFLVLSLEITLHVLADTATTWLFQHVRCHHARDGYAVGTTELWDEEHRLVALALQRARLRPFQVGEALGPDRR